MSDKPIWLFHWSFNAVTNNVKIRIARFSYRPCFFYNC